MNKKYYYVIIGVLSLILIGLCAKAFLTNSTNEKVTLSFNTQYENTLQNIEINKGESIDLPSLTREGYNFLGWYVGDQQVNDSFKFEKSTILVARWEKGKYMVSFNSNGGNSVKNIELNCGDSIKLPTNPTRNGYTFAGWTDKNGSRVSSGMVLACENTTLTANWNKISETPSNTFTVSFNSNGGSNVNSVKVTCGKTLSLPTNPTRSGYTFAGWTDKNGKSILNGALLACENITLNANWNKNEIKLAPLSDKNVSADIVCPKEVKKGSIAECQIKISYKNTAFNYVEVNLNSSPQSLIKSTNNSFEFDYNRYVCCPLCKCMSTNIGTFKSSNLISSNSEKNVILGTIAFVSFDETCKNFSTDDGSVANLMTCRPNGSLGLKTHKAKLIIKNTNSNESVTINVTKEYTVVE